jgi:hypothetical protein
LRESVAGTENRTLPPAAIDHAPATFSLSSLFLVVTLCAVTFGLFGVAPGLGILFAIVVAPATLRTAVAARRVKARGRRMDVVQKIETFVGSLFVVITIGAAACVAFVATCFPIGMITFASDNGIGGGLLLAFIIGGAVGLGVLFWLGRWLWPKKELGWPTTDAPDDRPNENQPTNKESD